MCSEPFSLAYHDDALKFLESERQPRKIRQQIKRRIDKLTLDPTPKGVKKLGTSDKSDPIYRLRQGDYRVLYAVFGDSREIVILDIDHRKDVYRNWERFLTI